jgi:hypothetical protein
MSVANKSLEGIFDSAVAQMGRARAAWTPRFAVREFGTITSIASKIAKVSGLPGIGFEEVWRFGEGSYAIASNIGEDEIGVFLLLTLGPRLFDNVPLDRVADAELASTKAVANTSAKFRKYRGCAKNLGNKDRESIPRVAHAATDGFTFAARPEAGSADQKQDVLGYFSTPPG